MSISENELRVLRRIAEQRTKVPKRDDGEVGLLLAAGLVTEHPATWSDPERPIYEITDEGIAVLLEADGPLTAAERDEWLKAPNTRFGREDDPQKLLPTGWKSFDVPRARSMMKRWRRYGY